MRSIKIKTELKIKSEQALVLTVALREALAVLEMPLPELAEWLQKQIEQNPALQFSEEIFDEEWEAAPKNSSDELCWVEKLAAPSISLHDHLFQQAREVLTSFDELQQMEQLIGNLDEKGFLDHPADSCLIQLLQSFDPPGIAAQNLQHCLLLQLERKEEQKSLAYRLLQNHYADLLHGRKELLCQKLSCTQAELQTAIQITLASLNLDPAAPFRQNITPTQTPDIFIEPLEENWSILLNDDLLPKFQLTLSPELARFESSARWIEKILSCRHGIITRIMKIVLEAQADFFHGKTSDLQSLSFKQAAKKLSLHESTISRAVKNKFLSCPQGIFPLRYFFPHAASTNGPSHHTAKERLKQLINRECKHKPLSDQQLQAALHAQGVSCARRTVTKYRQSLKIPPAFIRRQQV